MMDKLDQISLGPWQADGQRFVFDRHENLVAETYGRCGNAELIAAAPDMLFALRKIGLAIENRLSTGNDTTSDIIWAFGEVRHLLARMEGDD